MNSPYPVCAPARSAIITGMYPNSIGTGNMRAYREFTSERPYNESSLEIPYYSSKLAEKVAKIAITLLDFAEMLLN